MKTTKPTSGEVIGFAGQYYTLWYWEDVTNYTMTANGNYVATSQYTRYSYIKNISTSLEKAKELHPTLSIDEGLRGKTMSFSSAVKDLTPELIKFGKYAGMTITEIAEKDFNYLLWLADSCRNRETVELINGLPMVVEHFAEVKRQREEKQSKIKEESNRLLANSIKAGKYFVQFQYNAGSPDSLTFYQEETRFEDGAIDLPIIKSRLGGWVDSEFRVLSFFYHATGLIDDTEVMVLFPNGKHVQSMYPYNMVEISGVLKKLKGKSFKLNLIPIAWDGYFYSNDNGTTEFVNRKQILMVV